VGVQTLVEFLQKKGVEVDNNPNTKISDEHYNLLVKEFSKDKNLKIESERLIQQRHNKEKKESLSIDNSFAPTDKQPAVEKTAPANKPESQNAPSGNKGGY
jgi:hypothetical protein